MLAEQVIADGSLRRAPGGVAFDVRLPWYRSLPYSCVEGLDVSVDGEPVDPAHLRIELGGTSYRLAELASLYDRSWFVADAAPVLVARDAEEGPHDLDVTIHVRIPYIIESGVPLVMRERCVTRQTLPAAQRR